MNGESLAGLNNIHLKLKVNGTAASQWNSMSNTAKKGEGKNTVEKMIFFNELTPMGEWRLGWFY